MNNISLYKLDAVTKVVKSSSDTLTILHNISFTLEHGSTLAVVGASGSGKSTLLHILGTLDVPTTGTVLYKGNNIAELSVVALAELRRKEIGFVFQFHHLLPEFTVLENVALHARIAGFSTKEATERARQALEDVGLSHKISSSVTTLSGGERQRASIARAIVVNPAVILADEPTGSLDTIAGEQVVELLFSLHAKYNTTLIVVTHNMVLAEQMGTVIRLEGGTIYGA